MSIVDNLGLVEVDFHDIREGDIVGTEWSGTVNLGAASLIEIDGQEYLWYSREDVLLCSSNDSKIYKWVGEGVEESIAESRTRRGKFPEDGTLVLTETVGQWEEGLTFIAGVDKWYVYNAYDERVVEHVSRDLLVELFDQGKLVVAERF